MVGRFNSHKEYFRLLVALSIMKKSIADFHLSSIGRHSNIDNQALNDEFEPHDLEPHFFSLLREPILLI